MQRVTALFWGSISAFLGILSLWASVPARGRRWLAHMQIVADEMPLIGLVTGIAALWKGPRTGCRSAVLLGGVGSWLALRPWMRRAVVDQALARAMREGLGLGWQRSMPPDVHRRFAQHRRTELVPQVVRLLTRRVWITRDVLFAAPGGHPLRLDVIQPVGSRAADGAPAEAPRPAIIVLHGGTWFQGDKSAYGFGVQNRWFATHGYVVFDVQYRINAQWPAPLSDVKCAVRWVKSNAARLNVDPDRVALLGRSAGGHLALLAAYTANDPAYPAACLGERDGHPPLDERVCAVITSGAPTDLRLWAPDPDGAIVHLLGGLPRDVPDAYESSAPVTHVKPGLPPTLVIHGQRDRTVPPDHADLLVNRLRAAGVLSVALRVPGGRHGIDGLPFGLTGAMIQYDIDRFLAWAFFRKT